MFIALPFILLRITFGSLILLSPNIHGRKDEPLKGSGRGVGLRPPFLFGRRFRATLVTFLSLRSRDKGEEEP